MQTMLRMHDMHHRKSSIQISNGCTECVLCTWTKSSLSDNKYGGVTITVRHSNLSRLISRSTESWWCQSSVMNHSLKFIELDVKLWSPIQFSGYGATVRTWSKLLQFSTFIKLHEDIMYSRDLFTLFRAGWMVLKLDLGCSLALWALVPILFSQVRFNWCLAPKITSQLHSLKWSRHSQHSSRIK